MFNAGDVVYHDKVQCWVRVIEYVHDPTTALPSFKGTVLTGHFKDKPVKVSDYDCVGKAEGFILNMRGR